MKKCVIALIGLSLLGALQFACNTGIKEPEKPNFIFIYADNLGYGDIGCFGSKLHRTPHIDKMAKEGISLTTLYSSSGVCTPSRASLLTGCYAQRVDMHLNENGGWVLFPLSAKGLNPEENTIAGLLKDNGYATACIGKWKLHLPLDNKYDSGDKYRFYGSSKLRLIDLTEDIKEEHDVSEQYPEVVKRLLQHAEKISKELGDPKHKGEKVRSALYVKDPKPLTLE